VQGHAANFGQNVEVALFRLVHRVRVHSLEEGLGTWKAAPDGGS
jgi:hypothetical protein